MIRFVKGNLVESTAQALVNTVNTVGVMGKGIALHLRRLTLIIIFSTERHVKINLFALVQCS